MGNNEAQKEIVDKITALKNAVSYGILAHEDAEKEISMNIEKYIREEFSKYGVALKVNYFEANKTWRVRIPKVIQDNCCFKAQYYGATKKVVLQKMYDEFIGSKKNNITLNELFVIWYQTRVDDGEITRETYTKDYQLFNKWIVGSKLEHRVVKGLTVDDFNTFFKTITKGRKITQSSFNNLKTMLNLLFDFAVQDYGVANYNVVRELKAKKYKFAPGSNTINHVYTTEEIVKLWQYMMDKNTVYSLACALSFCLGCRVGEIKALRWKDIDYERQTIYIHAEVVKDGAYANQQVLKEHTKSGLTEGAREIPLFEDGLAVLKKIKEKNCDKDFLFLGKSGKFILTQEFNDNIKEACQALGIPYMSSHKARKWAVTEALRNGMDEVSLMYTFGWKSFDTVQHYVKPYRTQQSQLAVLSKVFNKSMVAN